MFEVLGFFFYSRYKYIVIFVTPFTYIFHDGEKIILKELVHTGYMKYMYTITDFSYFNKYWYI